MMRATRLSNTWFMGFTPNLLAGVWFGMDRPVPLSAGGRPQATGGYYAAPVWGRFMKHVYYGLEAEEEGGEGLTPALPVPQPWPMLPGLTTREIDIRTGKLWSRWCDEENRRVEMFLPGTEPTEVCDASARSIFRIPPSGVPGPRRR